MPKQRTNPTAERADARSKTTTKPAPAALEAPVVEHCWTGFNLPGFPEGVSPTLLLQYEERWVQDE